MKKFQIMLQDSNGYHIARIGRPVTCAPFIGGHEDAKRVVKDLNATFASLQLRLVAKLVELLDEL